jgi:SAM-dependent methyltransferase
MSADDLDGPWYHTIDLPDGTTTPGVFDTRRVADLVAWPPGLAGGRCLDVGTCDGFWAFEMERRGAAEVVAIDVDDRAGRRFEIARRALGSRVERLGCSVYDLDPAIHGRFAVVLCGTLLIHLRDPIRALERMRAVCDGELVLVECLDAFLDLVGRWIPCARLAPARGQWWRINRAGLVSALAVAGFEVVSTSRRFLTPFGPGARTRHTGWRRPLAAVRDATRAWPGLTRSPLAVEAVGLARGTYDIAVRARPRAAP